MSLSNKLIGNWYRVTDLGHNLFRVNEPGHVNFYLIKDNDKALLIDSGLGITPTATKELLTELGITSFDVIATHSHFDHIGLNHLAKKVWINKQEWEHCQKHPGVNMHDYYTMLKDMLRWPCFEPPEPKQSPWQATDFLEDNTVFDFGGWHLKIERCPGHTCGHIWLTDEAKKTIFLGDFVYDGTLYLHLFDSNLDAYIDGLEKLLPLLPPEEASDPWRLLPAHNAIPLDTNHPARCLATCKLIQNYEILPVCRTSSDIYFDKGYIFMKGKNVVYVRQSDLPQWANDPAVMALPERRSIL